MKKELQKQMDSMMEMTMEAITNNKKLEPALNELFKYAPQDEKYQFILLHEIFATLSSDEFKKTAAAKKNLCGCRSNWRLEAKKSPVVPGK